MVYLKDATTPSFLALFYVESGDAMQQNRREGWRISSSRLKGKRSLDVTTNKTDSAMGNLTIQI